MEITSNGLLRRARRDERGRMRGLLFAGVGIAGTFGSLVAMNPAEKVAAAEQAACAYERRILMTAIEADRVSNDDYAAPAGEDGLDELREGGFLASTSQYWIYTGLNDQRRPVLTPRDAEACATADSGATTTTAVTPPTTPAEVASVP